jgi:hypothetical protein
MGWFFIEFCISGIGYFLFWKVHEEYNEWFKQSAFKEFERLVDFLSNRKEENNPFENWDEFWNEIIKAREELKL